MRRRWKALVAIGAVAIASQLACSRPDATALVGGWTLDEKRSPILNERREKVSMPDTATFRSQSDGHFDFIVGTMAGRYRLVGEQVEFTIESDTMKWDEWMSLSRLSGKKGVFYMKWKPSEDRLYWTIQNKYMAKPYELCLMRAAP
jgi:hypothetical protein